jgi:putative aldouronate transport system substrate-binding protein
MNSTVNRRMFVRMTGGMLIGGVAALLEACSTAQPAPPTAVPAAAPTAPPAAKPAAAPQATVTSAAAAAPTQAAGAAAGGVPGLIGTPKGLQLPTRVPISGPQPDLPGSADGLIDPGYINYPSNPFKSVQETPGTGGDVNVATWTLLPPPVGMDSNALWQEANKQMNVTLRMNITPLADYQTTKLATIIASDDLPDILYIAPGTVVPGLPDFLRAKCQDLTPFLAGDAVKD